MNYKKHYKLLIESRRNRISKENTYYEKHHIVPRSMGGTNKKENLILLTAREHFIAHLLLWKIYKNKQMAFAFYALVYMSKKHKVTSNRTYEECKIARRKFIIENNKKHHKGKVLSENQKNEISKRFRKLVRTEQHCNRISEALKGRRKSKSWVNKISKSLKNFDWSNYKKRNAKISKANSGANNPRAKKVYMIDKNGIIKVEFKTMKDALKYVNKKNKNKIISKTTFFRRIVKNHIVNDFYFSFKPKLILN